MNVDTRTPVFVQEGLRIICYMLKNLSEKLWPFSMFTGFFGAPSALPTPKVVDLGRSTGVCYRVQHLPHPEQGALATGPVHAHPWGVNYEAVALINL